MKILLHATTLERTRSQFDQLGLPLSFITVDQKGQMWDGDKPTTPKDANPEVIWLSLEAFVSRQLKPFFETALVSGTARWFQSFSAGLDAPGFKDVANKGIRLTNSDAQAVPIAEYVLANVLAEFHPIEAMRQAQRDKTWKQMLFREVSDTTWLIVGLGHIGEEIAIRARAFGACIIGVKRSARPHALADEVGTLADLPKLLPRADIVVLSCALNAETRGLANEAFFKAMKPQSILVNIARGGVVEDATLLAALDRDTPRVAILDVFHEEPLPPTNPYWVHPKVRVSAHTSAAGSGIMARGDRLFLTNLQLYAKGEKLINEVDPTTI